MKIALLPLYVKLYDEVAPQYHSIVQKFADDAAETLKRCGFEVETAPICCVADEFKKAVRKFEAARCQALVTLHTAYSPSLEVIDTLCSTDLPIVVFDSTPDREYEFNYGDKLMLNHGIHGVQDMCNMLLQRKKVFLIAAGHYQDEKYIERLSCKIKSAVMAYKFTHGKVGSVGGVFAGMGDFRVPDGTFNMQVINYTNDPAFMPGETAIADEMLYDRENFTFSPSLPPSIHRNTTVDCLKLRKWIEQNQLDAFTINFLKCGKELGFSVVPFLECSKAMSRQTGYAGEGDVLTALFNSAIMQVNSKTTFTEMFCPDWHGDRIFLSHMGEMNLALMDQKPYLNDCKWIFSDAQDTAIAYGCLQSGKAVLANIAPGPDGKFTIIGANVRLTAQNDTNLTSMRGWFTPANGMPISEFLEKYSELGGTHHLVLSYDFEMQYLKDFAKLIKCDFIEIC